MRVVRLLLLALLCFFAAVGGGDRDCEESIVEFKKKYFSQIGRFFPAIIYVDVDAENGFTVAVEAVTRCRWSVDSSHCCVAAVFVVVAVRTL